MTPDCHDGLHHLCRPDQSIDGCDCPHHLSVTAGAADGLENRVPDHFPSGREGGDVPHGVPAEPDFDRLADDYETEGRCFGCDHMVGHSPSCSEVHN